MIKKILLLTTFAFTFYINNSNAQLPTLNMEQWTSSSGPPAYDEPVKWTTSNILSNFLLGGSPISVSKHSPGNSGFAARIETIKLKSNPTGGIVKDTCGIMFTGTVQLFPQASVTYGFPHNQRSGALQFYSKYSPNGADTAFVLVFLQKQNGKKRDTIGVGYYRTFDNTGAGVYVPSQATIIYNPLFAGIDPDTATIFISSSGLIKPKIGSIFYVDDFTFTAPTGINDPMAYMSKTIVYPNPANEHINFTSLTKGAEKIEIMDVTGRKVGMHKTDQDNLMIPTMNYPSGMYIYHLLNQHQEVIDYGKFNVNR